MRSLSVAFVLILLFFLPSCSQTPDQKTILSDAVNPNGCRIVGVIETIEDFNDNSGPCSENPCVTTVRVKNVVERGMSFNSKLYKEDIIDLKFEFTLSPTADLFEELKTPLPGLKVGDNFLGDIEKVISIKVSGVESHDTYKIYLYDKIED